MAELINTTPLMQQLEEARNSFDEFVSTQLAVLGQLRKVSEQDRAATEG
jgi:hypothetical protein